MGFDEARDEIYDPFWTPSETGWTEYDERVWREYCEMQSPLLKYVENDDPFNLWLDEVIEENERSAAALSLMYLEY